MNASGGVLYFDAHCHWFPALASLDGAECCRCCCGTGPGDWDAVRQAANRSGVVAAYGLHPWFLGGGGLPIATLEELRIRLEADPLSAVGEIGLDIAYREGVAIELQSLVFRAQLQLAQQLRRVAVIHCVQAWGVLMETLKETGPLPRGFVLHAYGGSAELVQSLVRQGAYFSFKAPPDGSLSPKDTARVRAVPPERLLLESDLDAAAGVTGPTAYWAILERSAAALAVAVGQQPGQIAALTRANALRCFRP